MEIHWTLWTVLLGLLGSYWVCFNFGKAVGASEEYNATTKILTEIGDKLEAYREKIGGNGGGS